MTKFAPTRKITPRPAARGAGLAVFQPQTPEQALGVAKVTTPPNEAPYKPGHSPAQITTRQLNAPGAVPKNPVDARVVQIQQHLKQLGYNVDADGIMGPITRAAMAASQNGTVPNVVHHPEHARQQAQIHQAHAEATRVVRARRSNKPFFPGQKPAGMIARPGGGMEPVYVASNPGPEGDPATQLNAEQAQQLQRMNIENQGGLFPYVVKTGLESLVPTRSVHAIANGHAPSHGDIASDVFNGALWLSPGAVAPALRTARVAAQAFREEGITSTALRTIREARGAIRTASEDEAALKRAQAAAKRAQAVEGPIQSPVKDQLATALKSAPEINRKQVGAILTANDVAARAVAHTLGTTPEHAYELMWKGAAFHDIAPTADQLRNGALAQVAQQGREDEVTNLSQVPEFHSADQETLARASRNLTRTHRDGAPPHAQTPKALQGLLGDLQRRAIEAADYRKWYANSAAGILAHVNGDVEAADKLAALIAVYSPRAEVYSKSTEWNNLDRALNAYDEFQTTGQISPRWSISSHLQGEGDWQTHRAQQIMQGNFEWDGLKTNRFYRNFLQHINPDKYAQLFGTEKFGTMDTWMRRAFGYPAAQKTEARETLFGTEHVPVGKKQEPITPRMYAFMEKANKAVGDSLGWSPEEVQAAIWTSIKAEAEGTPLSNAGFDFRDAFLHREAKRARPLSPEQLALAPETADKPSVNVVDAAIEASRAPDSGFTLTAGLNPDAGKTGYAVSYGAHEYRERAPLTRQGLLDFRNRHLALLKSDPALRVGGWHNPDDGHVYLDISRVFESQDEAMQFAREQGQLAIFDRANFDVIPTGLDAAEADAIKEGLKEQGRLSEQAAKFDDLLTRTYQQLSGKQIKQLTEGARRDAEDALFDWAERNPDLPESQMFRELYHDAQLARKAPDPELLFQDDQLVQAIAAHHGTNVDRQAILDAHAGEDLRGLPKDRRSNRDAQEIARNYMLRAEIPYLPPREYAVVDPERARKIAAWYDEAVSAPDDPEVRAAYEAMARETLDQYHAITREGYVFEFYPEGIDPYPSGPSAAIDDLRANRHLYVFPTDAGFGSLSEADRAHPLLQDSGEKWGDAPTTHNDIFRAVHDFFGHYKEGVGFRADGEENAWRAHSAMYSPEARRAMTSETRGQNSWVNFGPHAEANVTAKQGETVYADQKAVLAPEWVVHDGSGSPVVKGAVERTEQGHFLHLFRGADVSTALHELGHAVEELLPAEDRAVLAEHGLNDPETFARSLERYFYDGGVPDPKLRSTFRTLAEGMAQVYGHAEEIPGAVFHPEIARTFDRFFMREAARDPQWAARAGVSMLFQSGEGAPADPMLEAAAIQVDQSGSSIEDVAKMFGIDPAKLQEHIESGAHAAEQERILSNAQLDERYGAAETTTSAEDIFDKWFNQEEHQPRLSAFRDMSVQFPRSPSRATARGQEVWDTASERLERVVTPLRESTDPLKREAGRALTPFTSRARVPKQAAKNMLHEIRRTKALRANDVRTLHRIGRRHALLKAGEGEQLAHYYYAQLPESHRNGDGLRLVLDSQRSSRDYYETSAASDLLAELEKVQTARKALPKDTPASVIFEHLSEEGKLKADIADIPEKIADLTANIGKLERLVANPPELNPQAVESARILMDDHERIMVEAGLDPENAEERRGLLARHLGLEPDGTEVYIGHHQSPAVAGSKFPRGAALGRTAKPGSLKRNQLKLFASGRLHQSMETVIKDWSAAQSYVFHNIAKGDLAAMGEPVLGHVKADHLLVNPKGQKIPRRLKVDPNAQAEAEGFDPSDIEEYTRNYMAQLPEDQQRMIEQARAMGNLHELRQVPMDVAGKYFEKLLGKKLSLSTAGVRSRGGLEAVGKAVDMVNNAVYMSLIYSNPGYIPANALANLIMAGAQQGVFLPFNLVRSSQLLINGPKELRDLLKGEVGMGSTVSLTSGEQSLSKGVAHIVGGIPDNWPRVAALLHEAARAGVISKLGPTLSQRDYAAIHDLLTNPAKRALLNDITDRAVQAMVDFNRMGPTEQALAKRLLFVWAWIRGATRYPGRFALDHPARTLIGLWVASGQPGAPEEVKRKIDAVLPTFTHDMPPWLDHSIEAGHAVVQGHVFPRVFPTRAVSPVSTPLEMLQTIRGKPGAQTFAQMLNPALQSAWFIAQKQDPRGHDAGSYGAAIEKNLARDVPNLGLAKDLISPPALADAGLYPGDTSRLGRLERASRVFPIPVDPKVALKTRESMGLEGDAAAVHREQLEEQAKEAHMGKPPKEILLALDHKTALDHITGTNRGDVQKALKQTVEYYAEQTGSHDFDRVVAASKGNDVLARTMISTIREILVGPGLSAYESAVKTAAGAK